MFIYLFIEEALDVKTAKCESTIDKTFYSTEYIKAAYIPDHQLTMYPDLILTNLSFRKWKENEVCDLPYPKQEMKIKICRSNGSLKGLQFYLDVDSPATGYSGLLGMNT